jgi:hypothetical protein
MKEYKIIVLFLFCKNFLYLIININMGFNIPRIDRHQKKVNYENFNEKDLFFFLFIYLLLIEINMEI